MEKYGIKVDILPNYFLKSDGTFNKEEALNLCGKIAGVCYDKEGFDHVKNEPVEKTKRRIDLTLNNGHHSVYDHIMINFNLQNVPKILAMVLNNENQYTTSEKSARYTQVVREEGSVITKTEEVLYNKWVNVFKISIANKYGKVYDERKIVKLAQENARYLVTVFMPTQMIYSTTFRQINYIASWIQEYIRNCNIYEDFDRKLVYAMLEFFDELKRLNVLDKGLMKNEKNRNFSLFGHDLEKREIYYGDTYSTLYKASLAELAQAQRHRTLDYQMQFLAKKEYFIPPIIEDNESLVQEWLYDMHQVEHFTPQGELVLINEMGKYEDFILKCKERLCTAAQLEIMEQTSKTLQEYKKALEAKNHYLAKDIEKYSHGARCTFPDFTCTSKCNFKEGINLTRKI